jgi:DNA-binding CsgD family transcriptional regulator
MVPFNGLSKREKDVLKLLLQGKSNKLIAFALGISVRTVEFHLKNIYAKFQVSSRIELILSLGAATGEAELDKLGYSTVESPGESAENRDGLKSRMNWKTSFEDRVSILRKELEMKHLMTKHALVGVITALFPGMLWVMLLRTYGHTSLEDLRAWIVPVIFMLAIIGLSVGFIGKRNGNTLVKVGFSTMLATVLSPIAILPIMGFVVLPLGKLAEWMGLINRSTLSNDAATMLAMSAMLIIWLLLGSGAGSLLCSVSFNKPGQKVGQMPVAQHPF